MPMNFLPVVDRELRIGARRPSTYWTRTVLGAGVCLIWFFVLSLSKAFVSSCAIKNVPSKNFLPSSPFAARA